VRETEQAGLDHAQSQYRALVAAQQQFGHRAGQKCLAVRFDPGAADQQRLRIVGVAWRRARCTDCPKGISSWWKTTLVSAQASARRAEAGFGQGFLNAPVAHMQKQQLAVGVGGGEADGVAGDPVAVQ